MEGQLACAHVVSKSRNPCCPWSKKKKNRGKAKALKVRVSNYKNLNLDAFAPSERTHPLVNTQGVAHNVRLPWAGCLLALQAVAPQRFCRKS
jgi:hypothetical protein